MGHGMEAHCAGFPHSSFPPSADVLKRCSGIEPSQTGRRGCCCFVFCYRCRCCCSWFICRKGSGARAIMKISHLIPPTPQSLPRLSLSTALRYWGRRRKKIHFPTERVAGSRRRWGDHCRGTCSGDQQGPRSRPSAPLFGSGAACWNWTWSGEIGYLGKK